MLDTTPAKLVFWVPSQTKSQLCKEEQLSSTEMGGGGLKLKTFVGKVGIIPPPRIEESF